ncbi:SDR family NAD(P)-dependent oxidoreductase [Streptomyces sp. NPDC014733]|uniref:type I polyketide synthase n=1 Tax=Streptomyces sp. NPDC014733 TaxID=3364885 RepID=UPI00370083A6
MTPPDTTQTSASTLKRAYLTMERMQRRLDAYEKAASEPLAIIGLGCRLPGGADDADSYWDLLKNGVDAVTDIPADRWDKDAFFSAEPAPGKVSTRAGGFLDRVDLFDHEFFGISRREALFMDPQQRLTMEVAWEALENAGQSPSALAGSRTGVFMGVSSFDFATETLHHPLDFTAHASTGSAHSVVPGRLSYTLDLRGPSVAVDTACSSSLVALHQAAQSLRSGECDMALSGGVNVVLSPLPSVSFSQFGRMVSVDGRCKAFDASANGYVRSEGCGMVVLKRLTDAQRDGDTVLAVLRGGAVNQDGRSAGVTAPNGSAQRDVLRRALAAAGVAAEDVSLIEAHGTGTRLGDPIEVEALAEVYGRPDGAPVYLGSSKTNIGHPEAAAGIAALIKVVLSLHREAIPGTVHFTRLNPDISFDGTTFEVPTQLTPWPAGRPRRLAGVSSFGFSGTNAHMILEAAPERPVPDADTRRPVQLLALSAKNRPALTELAARYRDRLTADTPDTAADICHSANTGRAAFPERLAVTGTSKAELAERLAAFADGAELPEGTATGRARPTDVVFLFTGQGVQRVGMARGLYETQPTFRAEMDRCAELLRPHLERPLLDVLHPEDGDATALNETGYAQPAVFAVEYALAQLWRSWGVEPVAVLGHSFGEYVAACVAGAMSLEDGLKMAVARSRLMQSLAGTGAMAAIAAPELVVAEEIARYSADRIAIGAVNGPTSTTISGEREIVEAVCKTFNDRGVRAKPLHITTSSHSPLVDPILPELHRAASEVTFSAPRIPLISNVDGKLWSWEDAPDADYWCRHARRPVRFATGIATLLGMGYRNFIEVGPAPTLLGLVTDMLPADHDGLLLPSLRPQQDDWQVLLGSVAELHAHGGDPDWRGFDADYTRTKVAVPTYPFQRVPCLRTSGHTPGSGAAWEDAAALTDAAADGHEDAHPDEDLLHRLDWRPVDAPATPSDAADRTWLVLADTTGVGTALTAALTAGGTRAVQVRPGAAYAYDGGAEATVRRGEPADLTRLLTEAAHGTGAEVVHLWSLDAPADPGSGAELLAAEDAACMSAVHTAQALNRAAGDTAARLWLVTRGAVAPAEPEPVAVLPATLWGLGRSIQQEHAAIWGGLIDLDPAAEPADAAARLAGAVTHRDAEDQLALRGGTRYAARLVREDADALPLSGIAWRRDAAYLVTGGLGGLGLAVARSLAAAGARHLILAGRTPLPPRDTWATLDPADPAAARVAAVRELEALGTGVRTEALDVADEAALTAFLTRYDAEGRPPIRGIVHAAGVGDVIPLPELDADALAWHLRPKALGAWHLHRAFADRELDFFTLFSSTSAVLGSPFFAAYAAANAFLDALAHHRRAQGTPALSINWGIWQDVGMAAREAEATPGVSRGMETLRPAQALRVLHRLLAHDAPQIAVAPVDWADWGRRYREVSGSSLLAELVDGGGQVPAARAAARRNRLRITRDDLLALASRERRAPLTEALLAGVTATLDTSADRLGPDQPLIDLGVDSLMAVELKNAVEGGLGVSLPISAFLEGGTVSSLADLILKELDSGADASTGPAAGAIRRVDRAGDVASRLLAQLADLPDDQARAALGGEDQR